MTCLFDTDEVHKMLRRAADRAGSQVALAREIGVSAAFLNDILLGKREPSGKPVQWLGLTRRVLYEKEPRP